MKAVELRSRLDYLISNWGDLDVELDVGIYSARTNRFDYKTDTQSVHVSEGKIYISGDTE